MSDIVLGAIIGFAASALGTIITGIINYKNSKLQVSASREQLAMQHKYQEEQSRIDRLVESRENVLIPLREALSRWMEISNQGHKNISRVEGSLEKFKKEPASKELREKLEKEVRLYEEASSRSQEASEELAVFQGQISDATLDQLIEAAKRVELAAAIGRGALLRIFDDPFSVDDDTIQAAHGKDNQMLEEMRKALLRVNKRIEQLLNGEPTT